MERWEVVGTQFMNFDAQDGNHIEGLKLHCVGSGNSNVKGSSVSTFFCSVNRPEYKVFATADLPCFIEVEFNRYGKPSSFTLKETKGK